MHSKVSEMFNAIAPSYDGINRILSLGMDLHWRKTLVRHLPLRENLTVLDLATGTGDQILAILKKHPFPQRVVGIDLAQEMLEQAKQKLPPNVELLCADALNLPFTDESFDASTFSFGIRNVENPLTSLQEIYRVLKPKGRCLILEFSLPKPPIRTLYLLYLRHFLPRLGALLSNHPSAYRYLNQTIESFPYGADFCSLMKKARFTQIRAIPLAFGAVTLYFGDKD